MTVKMHMMNIDMQKVREYIKNNEKAFPRLEVNGAGHTITVRKYDGKRRRKEAPIVFGESDWGDIHLFRAPDSDPRKYSGAYSCTLTNLTGMPIIFSKLSEDCTVVTDGKIKRKRGRGHKVTKVKK